MLTHSVNWDVFIYWDRGPQRHGSLHHLALKLKRKVTELSCQVLGVGLIEDNSYGVGQEGEAARQDSIMEESSMPRTHQAQDGGSLRNCQAH